MMVGVDDIELAHLRLPGARPASFGLDAMIVQLAAAIATSSTPRIRPPDNLRGALLANFDGADA
jgi:hypothetical protein